MKIFWVLILSVLFSVFCIPSVIAAADEPVQDMAPCELQTKILQCKAYQNAIPEIQETVNEIVKFACQFSDMTEEDIFALPGTKEIRESPGKGDELYVSYTESHPAKYEFVFDRTRNGLSRVQGFYENKILIQVCFSPMHIRYLQEADIRTNYSEYPWKIQFYPEIMGIKSAISYDLVTGVSGKVFYWNKRGEVVFSQTYTTPTKVEKVMEDLRNTPMSEESKKDIGLIQPPSLTASSEELERITKEQDKKRRKQALEQRAENVPETNKVHSAPKKLFLPTLPDKIKSNVQMSTQTGEISTRNKRSVYIYSASALVVLAVLAVSLIFLRSRSRK